MNTERLATWAEFVAERLEAAARGVRAHSPRSRAGDDGGDSAAPRHESAPARKMLVLGGARSGKSHHAERLISQYDEVTYFAGGPPPSDDDPEWAARVADHKARRPAHWHTVESTDLATTLRTTTTPLLVDCLGTWLSRVLDELGAWQQEPGWQQRVDERLVEVVDAYSSTRLPVVAVSNEVGSGVIPATTSGRAFRDVLGGLNSRISTSSDAVVLTVAGRPVELDRPAER